ncbi:MAG: PAS domain-containing protein [Nitrospirota bacterium]
MADEEKAKDRLIEELRAKVKTLKTSLDKLNSELNLQNEIMSNMAEGVCLIRASDGIILYCNPKFEQMFAYDAGELAGKNISIVNAPTEKTPEETAREISESLIKHKSWQGELLNIKKTRECFWCSATVSTFEDKRYGTVWVSVHTDITDRKDAQEELDRFFNESRDILAIFSIDGHFTRVNPMFEKVLGYTKEEIYSKHLMELIHPDDRDATIAEVERQNKGSNAVDFVNRYLCKDGSYKTLSWSGGHAINGKIYANASV